MSRISLIACCALCICLSSSLLAFTDADIGSYQKEISDRPVGERIALWAERFVGTPYDPDPRGAYVTRGVVVADDMVDCMYLTFRSVELAMSHSPEEAIKVALDKRFRKTGIASDGKVLNYEGRFEYGEDMLESGKWGREITKQIGPVTSIIGSRGRERVTMVAREALLPEPAEFEARLKSGDIVFFIKDPGKRVAGEIVGHIGIIKREGDADYLIHASGRKGRGGSVKKVFFSEYLTSMPFVGIRVSRFD
jgi:hypothetical protein